MLFFQYKCKLILFLSFQLDLYGMILYVNMYLLLTWNLGFIVDVIVPWKLKYNLISLGWSKSSFEIIFSTKQLLLMLLALPYSLNQHLILFLLDQLITPLII